MALGSLTYVEIGGVDVSDYVSTWSAPERLNVTVEEAEILLAGNVASVLTIDNEQTVVIKRGPTTGSENIIFRGFVKLWSPKGAMIEVSVENKLGQLARKQITNTYDKDNDVQAGVLSAIVEDMVTSYGGLTITVTNSTGYARPLVVYPCNRDFVLERVDKLREVLDWVLRYDHTLDTVIFEPKGETINSTILQYNTDGSTNIHNVPKWEIDSVDMINKVEVIGRSLEGLKTETFSGDSSTTVFTLAGTPAQTEVFIGGTKQVLGIEGSSASYDYTVKQHLKQIVFSSAPTTGSDNVIVNYGSFTPISVILEDSESIENYGQTDPLTGEKIPFERSFNYEDVVTVEDAEQRAEELLSRFSNPLKSTVLEIDHFSEVVRAGQSIRVIDAVNNIDEFFIVVEVLHRYPEPVDIIHVGQERFNDKNTLLAVEDRLKKLENREFKNIDYATIRKDLNKAFRLIPYSGVLHRDTSYDGAWGKGFGDGSSKNDYDWGEAGALWQNTYTNSPTTYSIVHPDNLYEEDFSTEDFLDSGNTTATFTIATQQVSFSGTQDLVLQNVHLRIGGTVASPTSITKINVRVPLARITGNAPTVYAKTTSAGTWEEITGDVTADVGAYHTFSVAGSGVWLKVTKEDGSLNSNLLSNGAGIYCQVVS